MTKGVSDVADWTGVGLLPARPFDGAQGERPRPESGLDEDAAPVYGDNVAGDHGGDVAGEE